jgi:hypothetical protein
VKGVKLAGLLLDAGPVSSPSLLEIGTKHAHKSDPNDPTSLHDVFFRIGGAAAGKAATSLVVNSDDVILDNVWAWRADHGTGVGWTVNTADTGVVVNGDDVTAYGLFVEHYQRYDVIWNGEGGKTIMFQNEMPYDPPPGCVAARRRARLGCLQGRRLGQDARGLGPRELLLHERRSDDPRHRHPAERFADAVAAHAGVARHPRRPRARQADAPLHRRRRAGRLDHAGQHRSFP